MNSFNSILSHQTFTNLFLLSSVCKIPVTITCSNMTSADANVEIEALDSNEQTWVDDIYLYFLFTVWINTAVHEAKKKFTTEPKNKTVTKTYEKCLFFCLPCLKESIVFYKNLYYLREFSSFFLNQLNNLTSYDKL